MNRFRTCAELFTFIYLLLAIALLEQQPALTTVEKFKKIYKSNSISCLL